MIKHLIMLILICFVSFGQQVQKLTFDDVIKIALDRNVALKQAENNLTSVSSNIQSAFGSFLPTLRAGADWDYSRTQFKQDIAPNTNFTEQRSYSVGLSSSWNLFDGLANFANYSKSKNDQKSYQLQISRLKQDIIYQTLTRFYNVIKLKKLMVVQEENLLWNKKSLETIVEKNKVGQLPLADVYQQQVDYGNSELELIQAKNNFEIAKNDFISFLFLDMNSEYDFVETNVSEINFDEYGKIEQDFSDFSKMVDVALEHRYDYLSKQVDIASDEYNITISKSGHLPSLIGSFGAMSSATELNKLFDTKTFSAGLSLNIPIFSGWSVSSRVQLAEVNLKNSILQLEDKEKQIKVEIKKAYLDFQASKKRLDINNKNMIASEENRKYNQEKYNLGSGTLLNLLIANSKYVSAQTLQVNAIYDYLIQKKQIEYLLGTL